MVRRNSESEKGHPYDENDLSQDISLKSRGTHNLERCFLHFIHQCAVREKKNHNSRV